MPFPHSARIVRDPDVSIWLRMSALKGCAASFCGLTGLPFRGTVERLGLTWVPWIPREPPTDELLRGMLDALERERNIYLHALRALELKRVRAKLAGRRQLSRAERDARAELRLRAEAAVARIAETWNAPSSR